jgi:hypothetical protein
MDFAIIDLERSGEPDSAYFIEVNSFGAHYAAGSALFNWTHDYAQLHGETNVVELRFVKKGA